MAQLLYIESSPRKARSHSIAAARAFLDTYQTAHPGDTVETLDLWTLPLPEFDGARLAAKYAVLHGASQDNAEAAAWAEITRLAEQFKAADRYLISAPMWNFSIPYKLKHYIDVITQPGLTFSFSPETGYQGLVTGKPAVVVLARGGEYPAGSPGEPYDLQLRYLDLWLRFVGFTDIRPVFVNPSLGDPETFARRKAEAIKNAQEMARAL